MKCVCSFVQGPECSLAVKSFRRDGVAYARTVPNEGWVGPGMVISVRKMQLTISIEKPSGPSGGPRVRNRRLKSRVQLLFKVMES